MRPLAVACVVCGRILDESEPPALATIVDGEVRALCATCAARPAAVHAAARSMRLDIPDLASLLGERPGEEAGSSPRTRRPAGPEGKQGNTLAAPDETPSDQPGA